MKKRSYSAIKTSAAIFCAVLFSCLFVCLSSAALESSGKCGDNVYYTYSDGLLKLSGTGSTYEYFSDCDGDYDGDVPRAPWGYHYEVKKVIVGEGITRLGQQLFASMNLTSVELPSSLETLGTDAFGWTKVENVYIDSLKHWCSLKLETERSSPCYVGGHVYVGGKLLGGDLVLPDNITEIGKYVFSSNKDITSLTFGNSAVSFGPYAFLKCTNLKKVNAKSLGLWLSMQFGGANATPLCSGADLYINGQQLSSVAVPNGTKKLGNYSFAYIDTLTAVSLPESLTELGTGAFCNCTGITKMHLPAAISTISNSLFRGCTNLVTLEYTDPLTAIGDDAFNGCEKLTTYPVEEGLTKIGEDAFRSCLVFTEIEIPTTVTSVGAYAFAGCRNAQSLMIRSKLLTYLPSRCFENCTQLGTVFIPETVTSVGIDVFYNCHPMTVVYGGSKEQWSSLYALFRYAYSTYQDIVYNMSAETCSIVDGVIYNRNKTVLIHYPSKKSDAVFVVPEGVKTIDVNAFSGCYSLRSIRFPDSLTMIGNNACAKLYELNSVYLPASLKVIGDSVFSGCTKLKEVYVNTTSALFKNVQIGENNNEFTSAKFVYSTRVVPCENGLITEDGKTFVYYEITSENTEYALPEGVTRIAPHAFRNAKFLQSLTLPSTLKEIGVSAFYSCWELKNVNLPESLTTIDNYAFYNCKKLPEAIIPESVTTVGTHAFELCAVLTRAVLPENLTKIGNYAFHNCPLLASVNIPPDVTSIGNYAFGYCRSITKLEFGKKLTSIGSNAFYNCYLLGDVILPATLTSVGDNAFLNCYKLYFPVLPASLTNISAGAFKNCYRIEAVDISANAFVGAEAFSGCSSLKRASFDEGTTVIPSLIFRNCASLNYVFIPSTVTSFAGNCFSGCTNLTDVYYAGTEESWYKIQNLASDSILFAADIHVQHRHNLSAPFTLSPANYYSECGQFRSCSVCGQTALRHEDASKFSASLSFTKTTCNGKAKRPSVTVKDNNGKKLVKGADYTVGYSSNTSVGKAKVTVTFLGRYSGKKTLYFTIRPGNVTGLKATQTMTTVKLSWNKVPGAVTYRIYKYNSSTKKYVQIGSTKSLSYTVKNLKKGTVYTYFVKASKTVKDVKYLSANYVKIRTATKTSTPASPRLTAGTRKITAKWSRVSGATGYELYMASSKNGTYKRIRQTVKLTYTKTGLTKGKTYYFKVRTYKTVDGKKIYSSYSPKKSVRAK